MYIIERLHRDHVEHTTTTEKIWEVTDTEAKKEIARLKKDFPIAWDDRKAKGSIAIRIGENKLINIYKMRS